MANDNFQQIKLGAPSRIIGGAAPNAELSVQFMGLCEELTLKDGVSMCTKDGALKTAAMLLSNYYAVSDKEAVKSFMQQNVGNYQLCVNKPQFADAFVQIAPILAENPIISQAIAEWPDVINSIVDTGIRNWLLVDNGAYINTNINPQTSYSYSTNLIATRGISNAYSCVFGACDSNGDATSLRVSRYDNAFSVQMSYYSGNKETNKTFDLNKEYAIDISYSEMYANELLVYTRKSGKNPQNCSYPMFVGWANFGGKTADNYFAGKFEYFITKNGDNKLQHLVPFIRNGEAGMIDLVSGQFYGNANSTGSFTIVTE